VKSVLMCSFAVTGHRCCARTHGSRAP